MSPDFDLILASSKGHYVGKLHLREEMNIFLTFTLTAAFVKNILKIKFLRRRQIDPVVQPPQILCDFKI